MKIKSLVVAGVIAAVGSPVMAAVSDFKVEVSKDGQIIMDADSAALAKALEAYNSALKLSEEVKAERQKCLSGGNFWYDGYCVSKNPCKGKKATDKKHCVTAFKNVQVASNVRAANIVKTYAKNVLKWEGCANLKVPKSKATGQDFIECMNPADGDVRVFEFDDMSETSNLLGDNNYAYAMCVALKGKATFPKRDAHEVVCSGISKQNCENELNGNFESSKCKVVM